jgi:hypothetical protein
LTLGVGDVIGLGCEIYGTAQARGCKTAWQDWKAGGASIVALDSNPDTTVSGIGTRGFVPAEAALC